MALSSKRGTCSGEVIEAAAAGGGGVNICVVDGCGEELSECRKYYQRHKVCEAHSKTPQVSIHGQYLRFCQQCSRFHSLDEFDEGKRSCRKRLDGHNRRRRKPRPHNYNYNIFSPHQGTNTLQSAGPPVHRPIMSPAALWSGGVEAPASDPTNWVDHTSYAPSLLSSYLNLTPPQSSTLTHVMHHPQSQSQSQSGSGYGSGHSITITVGGPLNQLQGPVSAGGLENDCDMLQGWGSMTTVDTHDIDPTHCASLDHQTLLPFYWRYE